MPHLVPRTARVARSFRTACALQLLALGTLLHAPCALAEDLVRYRKPDGSIGFAQDASAVPPGAQVLPPPEKPKGSLQTLQTAPSRRAPESARRAPVPGAERTPGTPRTAEDRYAEQRRQLREEAEREKQRADSVRCQRVYRNGRFIDLDCSARARAKEAAEKQAKEAERKREELIEKCMDDDDCAPGRLMDDDVEEDDES